MSGHVVVGWRVGKLWRHLMKRHHRCHQSYPQTNYRFRFGNRFGMIACYWIKVVWGLEEMSLLEVKGEEASWQGWIVTSEDGNGLKIVEERVVERWEEGR